MSQEPFQINQDLGTEERRKRDRERNICGSSEFDSAAAAEVTSPPNGKSAQHSEFS